MTQKPAKDEQNIELKHQGTGAQIKQYCKPEEFNQTIQESNGRA